MIHQYDYDFVYNRFPKTEEDVNISKEYEAKLTQDLQKQIIEGLASAKTLDELLLLAFPVEKDFAFDGCRNPIVTRFTFLASVIDKDLMNNFFVKCYKALIDRDFQESFINGTDLKAIRLSLIEFAIKGCLEAQMLCTKLNKVYGNDDELTMSLLNKRCPNLERFIHAHEGQGLHVSGDDYMGTYEKALREIRSGKKATHWMWYIFPQMYGIPGTHSGPALHYGINGRIEAYQYIMHPMLRRHLVEISEAALSLRKPIFDIFDKDDIKFRSCIRLFATVSDEPIFKQIIAYYHWN